jgi:hypothetical protein
VAEIKVNLEAQSREFAASLEAATRHVNTLAAQIQALSVAQQHQARTTHQAAQANRQATQAVQQHTQATRQSNAQTANSASAIGRAVVAYNILYDVVKKTIGFLQEGFQAAVTNIDDFQKASIGTAAAITNIADQSANAGKTWDQLFHQNLKATKQTFFELEKLAARYFASSTDLQLAYNAFAQRGIVIRRTELEQLAQLTDMILLLTQGQQSSIQVQEEIRSLVNGTLRPTAQLGQLLKSYGKDIKQVAAEIKATQSLAPLQDILRGAAAATGEIQKTFQAAKNGFETTLRQIARFGFDQFYAQLVQGIDRVTKFMQNNSVQIAGLFGAVGAAANGILKSLTDAAEAMFKFSTSSKTATNSFDTFLAGVGTTVQLIIRSVQVLFNLFSELPSLFEEAGRALDIAFTPDEKIRDFKKAIAASEDAIKQSIAREKEFRERGAIENANAEQSSRLISESQVKKLRTELSAMQAPLGFVYEKTKEMLTGLPWSQGATKFGNQLDIIKKKAEDAFAPLTNFNVRGDFNKRLQEIAGGRIVGEANARNVATQDPEVTTNISRKFAPTPEEIQHRTQLTNTLIAAQDRLARSIRSTDAVTIAAETDVKLQELRRTLALLEQGFIATTDEIDGLLSPLKEVGQFFAANTDRIAFGDMSLSVNELKRNLTELKASIVGGVFQNLDQQLQVAKDGLEKFKAAAKQAAIGLIATEVTTQLRTAADLRAKAQETFQKQVDSADRLLVAAQEEVRLAKESKDVHRIAAAEKNLASEEYLHRQALEVAGQKRIYDIGEAINHEEIARANHKRIIAQMDAQIAEQSKRLGAERLRILQAENVEVGKLLQNNARLLDLSNRRLVTERAKAPRTDLQAAGEEINQAKVGFALEEAEVAGSLQAIEGRLRTLGLAATQADVDLLTNERTKLAQVQQTNAATLEQMRINRDFAVSWAAVGNAVQRSLDTVVDGILASFEGKKTNFTAAFKGIADGMVKDSLKNVFQSITTQFQKGFQSVVSTIAPGMESTLGPAFMAGFGLIASFVLGQLMGDQGGEATASNPTIGIQSSEQIRGLIGGETQIPIGQIGESLQDALVPTNLLLSRIAGGIDRLAAGGFSTGQIESIIERSVNDALQIQPA